MIFIFFIYYIERFITYILLFFALESSSKRETRATTFQKKNTVHAPRREDIHTDFLEDSLCIYEKG